MLSVERGGGEAGAGLDVVRRGGGLAGGELLAAEEQGLTMQSRGVAEVVGVGPRGADSVSPGCLPDITDAKANGFVSVMFKVPRCSASVLYVVLEGAL